MVVSSTAVQEPPVLQPVKEEVTTNILSSSSHPQPPLATSLLPQLSSLMPLMADTQPLATTNPEPLMPSSLPLMSDFMPLMTDAEPPPMESYQSFMSTAGSIMAAELPQKPPTTGLQPPTNSPQPPLTSQQAPWTSPDSHKHGDPPSSVEDPWSSLALTNSETSTANVWQVPDNFSSSTKPVLPTTGTGILFQIIIINMVGIYFLQTGLNFLKNNDAFASPIDRNN